MLRALPHSGTIYDLAAPPYGYADRGDDFVGLRAEPRRLFRLSRSCEDERCGSRDLGHVEVRCDSVLEVPGATWSRSGLASRYVSRMGSNLAAAACVSVHCRSVDDLHTHGQTRAAQMLELPGGEAILRRLAAAVG